MSDLLSEAAARLAAAGIDNARAEARLLLAHALGVTRDETLGVTALAPEQQAAFDALAARRAAREPLAYITGTREFWSLPLKVGPGVLVPRPETETLIEAALEAVPDRRAQLAVGDLGTGSGAILIAALKAFPHAVGLGLDTSREALAYARANGLAHNLSARAEFRLDDWADAPEDSFDLVFSNPPYISGAEIDRLEPEVARYEPRAALDGGADGLDAYRALAGLLPRLLTAKGMAVLELGAGQDAAMAAIFAGSGLEIRQIKPDLAGVPRALVLEKA